MTDQQINAAIAKACGWRKEDGVYMWTANGIDWTSPDLRDYCADLNAMLEVESLLSAIDLGVMAIWVARILTKEAEWFHATARQRAEAFLRTLGKWEEGK
jgi:hypothetical protein